MRPGRPITRHFFQGAFPSSRRVSGSRPQRLDPGLCRGAWGALFSFVFFFLPVPLFAVEDAVLLQKKIDALGTTSAAVERQQAVLHSELGTALYRDSQFAAAAQAFETSLSFGPPQRLKKHIYLYMGKSYESSDRPDKAIDAYEASIQHDRRNWKRYRDLAALYERVSLYDKAVINYQRALSYRPRNPEIGVPLARTWRKKGLLDNALTTLKEAMRWNRSGPTPETLEELSRIYYEQGRYQEAAQNASGSLSLMTQASAAQWARLVYLSAMAENEGLAQRGLNGLRATGASYATMLFYENLVQLFRQEPQRIISPEGRTPPLLEPFISSLTAEE